MADSEREQQGIVKLMAVGDIMLDREIGTLIGRHGPLFPFEKMLPHFRESDVLFGNLECSISRKGKPDRHWGRHMSLQAHPRVVQGLKQAGFTILGLANNHVMNHGTVAMKETMRILRANEIYCVGAGETEEEAYRPVIVTRNGVRMAFLSFTSILNGTQPARKLCAGVAHLRPCKVVRAVRCARQAADLVVVSMHWGQDYRKVPLPQHMELGRRAIDAGACLVLGHHPHVIQGIENYKKGIIIYSLGNHVFDDPSDETAYSILLKAVVNKTGIVGYQIVPLRKNVYHQPYALAGQERDRILELVEKRSEEMREIDIHRIREIAGEFVWWNLGLCYKERVLFHLKNIELRTFLLALPYILNKGFRRLVNTHR